MNDITNPDAQDRIGKIGSSDIAAVLGRNPYCTPRRAWDRITGKEQVEENEDMRRGHLLEEPIAQLYAARRPRVDLTPTERIQHPSLSWMHASIDRIATVFSNNQHRVWIVEIKAPRSWGAWRQGPPDMYVLQVRHQLGVARASGLAVNDADIVALCGELREWTVQHDEGELESMWNQVVDWYERYVRTDTPPPATETIRAGTRDLQARDVGVPVVELVADLDRLRAEKRRLEAQEEALADVIREEFGAFHALTYGGTVIATRTTVSRQHLDTAELRRRFPEQAAACTSLRTYDRIDLPKEKA